MRKRLRKRRAPVLVLHARYERRNEGEFRGVITGGSSEHARSQFPARGAFHFGARTGRRRVGRDSQSSTRQTGGRLGRGDATGKSGRRSRFYRRPGRQEPV